MNYQQTYRCTRLSALMLALLLSATGCDTINVFSMSALTKKIRTKDEPTQSSEQAPDKINAIKQYNAEVTKLLKTADDALNRSDLDLAEQSFQALKTLDANHLRAAEGLRDVSARRIHLTLLDEAKSLLGKSDDQDKIAAAKLRSILVENPNHTEARALYKDLITKQDAKRAEMLRKRLSYKNPVSLQFRDVGLKVIIESLSKGTGVNFILDQEISSTQKATLFVNNVMLENAIELLAQTNQLRMKILNENSVVLYPNNPTKIREYQDLVIRSFFLEYAEPKLIGSLLTSMLGIKQVQTDDRLPMIMIKDTEDIMGLAEKLIASQDIPDPEVMLELEVLEVKRTRNLDIGATWPNQLTLISPAAGLTLRSLENINRDKIGVSPNPSVVFNGKDSDVNLLANPRIRVKNKDKARIHIGDRVPIITSNVSSTGVISENVQYIDAGLKLEVEPNISLGGDVNIKVNLDVSSIGTATKTNSGSVVYQIGTRSTNTQLRLKDGETQVLAGLISDEDRKNVSKLPGLGDLPLLGRLFSNHGDEKTKTEIVLSITPHIIREKNTPSAELAEYWIGSEAQAGRSFKAPTTQEGLAKMFTVGRPPGAPATPAAPAAAPAEKPQGLNVPLSPELSSAIERIRNIR